MRVGYSYLGLLAGDAALLLLALFNALRISLLLRGQLKAQLLLAVRWFIPVAIVSMVGWMMIGVPVVLIISSERILKTAWSLEHFRFK